MLLIQTLTLMSMKTVNISILRLTIECEGLQTSYSLNNNSGSTLVRAKSISSVVFKLKTSLGKELGKFRGKCMHFREFSHSGNATRRVDGGFLTFISPFLILLNVSR